MNGAGACRFRSFVVTELTMNDAPSSAARTAFDSSSLAIFSG